MLRTSNLKPDFPEGWYALVPVNKLKGGRAQTLDVCGKHLIVFIDKNQEPNVFDRACPHMGMDLGKGKVKDCIVTCPYHGGSFSLSTGDYIGDTFVSPMRLRRFPSVLRYGWAWFYNGLQPKYEIPFLDPEEYTFTFQTGVGNATFVDMMINSIDSLHLRYVHGKWLGKEDVFCEVEELSDYSFRFEATMNGRLVEGAVLSKEVIGPSLSINQLTYTAGKQLSFRILNLVPIDYRKTRSILINCSSKKDKKVTYSNSLPPFLKAFVPNYLLGFLINVLLFTQDIMITRNIISERKTPDSQADRPTIQYLKILNRLERTTTANDLSSFSVSQESKAI